MCNALDVICLPHDNTNEEDRGTASPRFARLRLRVDNNLYPINQPKREHQAGDSTVLRSACTKGRQGRGFARCGKEAGQGQAHRSTPAQAHLPPVARLRSLLGCKEPSAAPLGRNRAHCSLRAPACLAPCGKRACAVVTLAARPLPCHIALLSLASALPWMGASLPSLRCVPCLVLCVYICKRFTIVNRVFTIVKCLRL